MFRTTNNKSVSIKRKAKQTMSQNFLKSSNQIQVNENDTKRSTILYKKKTLSESTPTKEAIKTDCGLSAKDSKLTKRNNFVKPQSSILIRI